MMPQHHLPADIERTSMKIIAGELAQRGLDIPPENAPVVKRVIHTTADFDYAQTLHFTPGAVAAGIAAMHAGATIITDTNMALAGITKPGLAKLGGQALCFMADPAVAAAAKQAGTTRAVAAMHTPALLVVPVFRPVVPGYVFKSLFVFTICVSPPRSESIQIWEYSRIFGWRSSSTLMRATSRAEE